MEKLIIRCLIFVGVITNIDSTSFLKVPSYIMAELNSSTIFNISWNGNGTMTTLTFDQIINGTPTKVIFVNGMNFESLNNWKSRTVIDLDFENVTNVCTMTLTLDNVALEDEGLYKILVKEDMEDSIETVSKTADLRIDTYARPTHLEITEVKVNKTQIYAENSIANFICTGNAGRPLGRLELVQSEGVYGHRYKSVRTFDPEEITGIKLLANGTFTFRHSFNVTVNRNDNNKKYKCRIIHKMPEMSMTESQSTIRVAVNFSQAQINISPSEVVLTTTSPVNTTFRCTISSGTNVTTIFSLQIIRKGETGKCSVVLAQVTHTSPTSPILTTSSPQGSSVSGKIDTTNLISSMLTLTRPTEDVLCSDRGYYECAIIYQAANHHLYTVRTHQILSMYTLPSDVILSARKNGQLIQGTASDEADVDVGDMVQLTCIANIGSDNATRIRWKRTSETGTEDDFITYNPPDGIYDDGTPISGPTECTHSRTAIMSYTVTSLDAKRDNKLAFQCCISVVPPGQHVYETQSSSAFYIHPVVGNTRTAKVHTCPGFPLWLAVVITSVVLLFIECVVGAVIYYVINRRRKTLPNSSADDPNLYEIPIRCETEHIYNL